ncbi:hypothetical protein [Phytobacter diazotrophicus]|uniref:hypothetical protein n=1 Tax=Phytobacter diazotrophicus TaxID=395631 RepID=UPI001C999602|nr:hypothetical protein [Phytobacter diazotrophicus]
MSHPPRLYAAAVVIISQMVMIPMSIWTIGRIDKYGYCRLVMPVRVVLAANTAVPLMMLLVQVQFGLATSALGVVVPSFIVALPRGSAAYQCCPVSGDTDAGYLRDYNPDTDGDGCQSLLYHGVQPSEHHCPEGTVFLGRYAAPLSIPIT